MVMGVCRHVLNQDHDAEDAFQATFLTLSRKAGTIRDRRVLASWLYEVAYRIAVRARAGSVRRRQQEKEGVAMTARTFRPEQENQAAWNELRPILHDEVNRLPDKYRLPVILSYLEGRTNEEVATLLDWPVGTVKGRLSRAREHAPFPAGPARPGALGGISLHVALAGSRLRRGRPRVAGRRDRPSRDAGPVGSRRGP